MTLLVDAIVDQVLGYSPLALAPQTYLFLDEGRLQELQSKRKESGSKVSLVGKKRGQETGYFFVNAWMFGEEILRIQAAANDAAIGVLFRDSDGTRSSVDGIWMDKVDSMIGGFQRSGLGDRGVPMVPRPKSEAWLLCAARQPAYTACEALEERSGNDASPHSLKSELTSVLKGDASATGQAAWLAENGFDDQQAAGQMRSFKLFRQRLFTALTAATGIPAPAC